MMPFLSVEGMLLRWTCAVTVVLSKKRGSSHFMFEYNEDSYFKDCCLWKYCQSPYTNRWLIFLLTELCFN